MFWGVIVLFLLISTGNSKVSAVEDLKDLFDITKRPLSFNIKDLLGIGGGGDEKYPAPPGQKRPCPLCDSSVYSYCGDKLFHDSCCCSGPYDHLPRQCHYADCSFLHANSCYEHRLITQCCCTNYILHKK